MKREKQGVSLIVLVITIIIMIILAAAVILALNNSNIIERADDAVIKTDMAQIQELASIAWTEAYADGKKTETELETSVINSLKANGYTDATLNKYDIIVTTEGVTVTEKVAVPSEWSTNVTAIVDTVPIPKGFVASSATDENTKEKGLVIYEGTERVTDANVETARRTRNQYVWIPVDKVTFEQSIQTTEANNMYESVIKYSGFYIARYEAGIDQSQTNLTELLTGTNVYSQMNKRPYFLKFGDYNSEILDNGEYYQYLQETGGAVEVARSIYPVSSENYGVVSTLTYGEQWDYIMQLLLDKNIIPDAAITTNSVEYGFYKNSNLPTSILADNGDANSAYNTGAKFMNLDTFTLDNELNDNDVLTTGAYKKAKIYNIYDMAGNLEEWTMESERIYARGCKSPSYGSL